MHDFAIGRALGRAIQIWFRNLVPFLLLSLVVYSPLVVLTYLHISDKVVSMTEGAFASWLTFGAALLGFVLSATLVYGVVMQLRGQPAPLGQCISIGLKRLLPVIGVSMLSAIVIGVGFVLLVVPGIIFYCMLYVAVPASVVERPGLLGALRRSRELTRDYRLPIFGLLILVGVTGALLTLLLEKGVHPSVGPNTYLWLSLAQQVIVGSFSAVLVGVVYHDLRVAKEGASTEDLARIFE
jgi:hypothetical protein